MPSEFEAEYQADQNRYKEMTNQATDLRNQAIENYKNKNYEEVIDICLKFLALIQKLPQKALELYCQVDCEIYNGELVIYTASILNLLHLIYYKQNRVLEALVCIQKANKIIQKYKLVNSDKAKNWIEYRMLLMSIEDIYLELKPSLNSCLDEYKKLNLLNNNLEINRDFVLSKYPTFDSKNFSYLENYYPLLLQRKLGYDNNLSSQSSSCFIATAAYSTSTHPDLDTFRNFRDEKLLTNPLGKPLVNLYYQLSPSVAQYVEKQPAIKSFVKHRLERLAQWMRNQGVKN